MSSPFETHGAHSWQELSTSDPAAAMVFYGPLFGWTFTEKQMEMASYHIIENGGVGVGGIMQAPEPGMPAVWTGYVTVTDVDAVAAKAVELGGELLYGPQDIPEVGRFCWIRDPQGAVIAAISYAMG
ncbi:VOC family protein [Ferrimonas sediminicola]|uniref:VOC family protein n=1 Tax=Ferrimonas sediminicola TaxID=2569538 RepID=A0A4U1BFN4_9GAMM|nr:VOC family protein [Ferrimonas sediminicola]TKB48831.1 VOC family protein [Ferrimonas sediminicola]